MPKIVGLKFQNLLVTRLTENAEGEKASNCLHVEDVRSQKNRIRFSVNLAVVTRPD